MVPTDGNSGLPPPVAAWLQRQAPEVRRAIRAAVDFATDTVRDARLGEPASGAIDCLRRLAELDIKLPDGDYFRTALDLLDKAGALALQLGVSHCRTENSLRMFLSLAGTALFADRSSIARFEKGFRPDSAIDDVILYLQAELEMLDGGFPGE